MTPRILAAALAASFVPLRGLVAQTAPARPASSDDSAVVLNPFTVTTDRDTGFVAASSLAGGRLAGELKDTPVAYSVINREFIDALAITNLADAAGWAPNTVLFVNPDGSGIGADYSFAQGSFNVRGAGGGRQRNFFSYNAPMDSYAIERFDFGRGPNAILFGNGGLGGVSSVMTKQARLDSAFTTIQQSAGSWDNYRTTIDVNRPFGKRFAVRAAGVYADAQGWRDRALSKNKAAFLTTTFKIARDTTLRLEGEYGETASTQPLTNLLDRVSGWDGVTTFTGALATLPANANQIGVGRRPADYLVYDPHSGLNAVMNYQNDPVTFGGGENVVTPVGEFVAGTGNANFNVFNSHILYSLNVPSNRFDRAIAGSAFRVPSDRFTQSSDAPVFRQRYKDLQLTFDHRIGPVFIQAAADINRTFARTINIDVNGIGTTYIDINRVLPNGAANPHFLQPYGDAPIRMNTGARNAQGARLALGYQKDAGKWGNYTTNVMLGSSENSGWTRAFNQSVAQNPDRRRWGSAGLSLGATDMIRIRRYWNEPWHPISTPATVRYINPVTGVDKEVTPMWALMNDRPDVVQKTKSRFDYGLAALNAKFFRNRLVLLGAVRQDSYRNEVQQQVVVGDYSPTDWDGVTPVYKPAAPADYATLTYTPKDASGRVVGPATPADTRPRDGNGNRLSQYANDRFKDDYNAPDVEQRKVTRSVGGVFHVTRWLSPYANYAETFNAPSSIQRIDSSFLPATVAKGVDLGIRMTLFGGRINASAVSYVNREENATFGQTMGNDLNALANANALGDTSTAGRNVRSFPGVPSVFNDMQDREARGYEFELVANPTRQWRVTFNVGLPKVYSTNAARDQIKFYDANKETLKGIVLDAGGLINASDVASVNTDIPLNDRSPDVNQAVGSYNNLRNLRANFVAAKRVSQDQPSINFYNDYTIGSGRLKGLRIGGGVQYRAKQIAGYRATDTIVDPANPTRAIDNPDVDAYTAVYTPNDYYNVVLTLGYTVRLKERRQLEFLLRVDNLTNEREPMYAGGSTVVRPLGGDYNSPARETVANAYALRAPVSFTFSTTLKL
jgi:outer membrane receptor protein involved in Fe transport